MTPPLAAEPYDEHESVDPGAVKRAQQNLGPSQRRLIAESWWIASELAARHPELVIWEMHPGGGQYDCLALLNLEATDLSPIVQLNRAGSLQVMADHEFRLSWAEALADPSPHGTVKAVEKAARLTLTGQRPPSTRRTLAYRFMAVFLRLQLHDRHNWDVRNEFLDASDLYSPDDQYRGYLASFPAAAEAMRSTQSLGLYGEPHSQFWAILRDDKPAVIISLGGILYQESKTFDLMAEYRKANRNITKTVVTCVGEWLA